jgi:malate dehydrogenase (oxaloacetate-decarboxylating)
MTTSAADAERLARAAVPAAEAMRLHPFYRGKIQILPKCPVRGPGDFAIWYSPGVAAPCQAIAADRAAVYEHTNKGNSIAIVSDGTRVLGLGDIGPRAGLPVMEGKALLFKYLGGVDAVPLCLDTKDPDEIVAIVKAIAPSFGAINLEDIAQPKCFRILDALRDALDIPVWHDDQQGTATVVLAGLVNALKVVGKDLRRVRIALIGMGAANVAIYRLLSAAGADPLAMIGCDTQGTLHRGRSDIEACQDEFADTWRVCRETNAEEIVGGIEAALRGADACIAFTRSGPGIIRPDWVRAMAKDAIVIASANPVPEIWPWEAAAAGAAVVATGRSDFLNQVNNSLAFPGLFRGVLDVRARAITGEMAIAAAGALAACIPSERLARDCILPRMEEPEVAARVAAAVASKAQELGLATLARTREAEFESALATIGAARRASRLLCESGLIPPAPPG